MEKNHINIACLAGIQTHTYKHVLIPAFLSVCMHIYAKNIKIQCAQAIIFCQWQGENGNTLKMKTENRNDGMLYVVAWRNTAKQIHAHNYKVYPCATRFFFFEEHKWGLLFPRAYFNAHFVTFFPAILCKF